MRFELESDPALAMGEVVTQGFRNIYAFGQIVDGDAERFIAFVQSNNIDAAKVVFHSPGGSLLEGVKLGRVIRELGFVTDIGLMRQDIESQQAICASACAYAFAGGVSRFMYGSDRGLGLHQFRSVGPGVSERDAQVVSGLLVAYLSEMGVDATAFALASVSDPDEMIWLSRQDAIALNFVNNGEFATTAEIRISEMLPYLRLNQDKFGVGLRVLFLCWNNALAMQAGIVTDPEQSQNLADEEWVKRSYLELDSRETLVVEGASGVEANDSTVWLARDLTTSQAQALLLTDDLGIWLDGFGMVRAGGTMDLRPVREQMTNYFRQCSE